MLDKHLIAKTRPLANAKNVVTFNEYRITVLDGRLFRIENDVEKIFEDKATQSVWYRDMQAVPFTNTVKNDCVEVTTDYVTLFVDTNNFNNSYVLINGAKIEISNKGNLLGTYRTLDGCDADVKDPHINTKKIKIETGVCSKTGVAVIDDTQSLILDSDGKIYERRQENKDIYVFAYGNDYRSAVKALYMITGTTPIIPRYALGNWWSRYHAYTDKEYLHILDDYENAGIPVSVATIDMDWHWSNYVAKQKKIPTKYLTYKVVVEFKEKTKAQLAIERANYVLIRAEDITILRSKLYDAIKVSKSVSKMKGIVKNAECKQITKDLVLEAINYL